MYYSGTRLDCLTRSPKHDLRPELGGDCGVDVGESKQRLKGRHKGDNVLG